MAIITHRVGNFKPICINFLMFTYIEDHFAFNLDLNCFVHILSKYYKVIKCMGYNPFSIVLSYITSFFMSSSLKWW